MFFSAVYDRELQIIHAFRIGCLPLPEIAFFKLDRYLPAIHMLNLYVSPGFYGKDHTVDVLFFSLDLHGDCAVPLIPYPAGTAIKICGLTGPPAEAHSLNPTVEDNMFSNHA